MQLCTVTTFYFILVSGLNAALLSCSVRHTDSDSGTHSPSVLVLWSKRLTKFAALIPHIWRKRVYGRSGPRATASPTMSRWYRRQIWADGPLRKPAVSLVLWPACSGARGTCGWRHHKGFGSLHSSPPPVTHESNELTLHFLSELYNLLCNYDAWTSVSNNLIMYMNVPPRRTNSNCVRFDIIWWRYFRIRPGNDSILSGRVNLPTHIAAHILNLHSYLKTVFDKNLISFSKEWFKKYFYLFPCIFEINFENWLWIFIAFLT